MFDELAARAAECLVPPSDAALPLFLIRSNQLAEDAARAGDAAPAWAKASGFKGAAGAFLLVPGAGGAPASALLGVGDLSKDPGGVRAALGAAPALGGDHVYAIAPGGAADAISAADAQLAWAHGAYRFTRYKDAARPMARLACQSRDPRAAAQAEAAYLARDLINTPAADMGPAALEAAARSLGERHGAEVTAIIGAALIDQDYPMIHAVGRAGPIAPRLLDLRWGAADAPKVTIVGKGVCFDTGGLDVKPPRFMRNMKKDMGGAAAALGLAHMIMALGLPVRLRMLVPAVENSVAAESFRPGDVLTSRAGLTVEIGDTDAEGRLVLADALTEADGEAPDILLDFATLTGAARVALGPEIAPFYTADDAFADALAAAGDAADDPLWRMPLWPGYRGDLRSSVADLSNVSTTGFAGSITAALFLERFVQKAGVWAHFDIFGWNAKKRPGRPEGGELCAARAALGAVEARLKALG